MYQVQNNKDNIWKVNVTLQQIGNSESRLWEHDFYLESGKQFGKYELKELRK